MLTPMRYDWQKVVFAADCDEDGNCPQCEVDYTDCECPGPTQDDLYEYKEVKGQLLARRKDAEP